MASSLQVPVDDQGRSISPSYPVEHEAVEFTTTPPESSGRARHQTESGLAYATTTKQKELRVDLNALRKSMEKLEDLRRNNPDKMTTLSELRPSGLAYNDARKACRKAFNTVQAFIHLQKNIEDRKIMVELYQPEFTNADERLKDHCRYIKNLRSHILSIPRSGPNVNANDPPAVQAIDELLANTDNNAQLDPPLLDPPATDVPTTHTSTGRPPPPLEPNIIIQPPPPCPPSTAGASKSASKARSKSSSKKSGSNKASSKKTSSSGRSTVSLRMEEVEKRILLEAHLAKEKQLEEQLAAEERA